MPTQIENNMITQRPYAERQFIVVARDDVVEASREAERAALAEKKTGVNWVAIGEVAMAALTRSAAVMAVEAAIEAINAWSRARDSGINVTQVSATEAKMLTFPPGHPRDGVFYIGHPAKPDVYYTMAEFHRVTFEHKFSEATNLLMHLGATKIRVEHVVGWSKEFSSRISVALGAAGDSPEIEGGIEGGAKSRESSNLLYEASLVGTSEPKLPESLVWYPHEATWQTIADGRINFGLKEFNLSITYQDDFGVNAGIKAAVQKVGLDIGGSFEDHQSTVWRVEGEFA